MKKEKKIINLDRKVGDYEKALNNLRFFDLLMIDIFKVYDEDFNLKDAKEFKDSLKFEKLYRKIKDSNEENINYCFVRNGKEVSYEEAMKYLKRSVIGACVDEWPNYGMFGRFIDRFIGFFEYIEIEEKEYLRKMNN